MAECFEGRNMMNDFIIIGEFCEVYGPRPVLTIPSNVASLNNNEQFNLEEFLLYIMTTDYQSFPGEKWDEATDVCCIRTHILPDFHAILHYFTLKDPTARGCVRPSCIAYVTQSQTKLYHFKREIMSTLSAAAQIFKHANIRWMNENGHKVNFSENMKIRDLLRKWDHLSKPLRLDDNQQSSWTKLCPAALNLVISGLLKFHRTSSHSLKEHILEHQEVLSNLELFDCVIEEEDFSTVIENYSNIH